MADFPSVDPPFVDRVFELGTFPLEAGGVLPDARLAYRVYGRPDSAASNVVLFPLMYSGRLSSVDHMIGPGRALDPARLCLIVPAQLGNGESSSPSMVSPDERTRYAQMSIADDVRAQDRLVTEIFGVSTLSLIIGYSMGAMQAYEWATRHPRKVSRLAIVAGTARPTRYTELVVELLVRALQLGDEHARGQHGALWSALGVSPAVYDQEVWCASGFASRADFVRLVFEEDYADHHVDDLICQLNKWRRADVSHHASGDLTRALGRIEALTRVICFQGDQLFPVEACALDHAGIPRSEMHVIRTAWGHYAFSQFDPATHEEIDQILSGLLSADP